MNKTLRIGNSTLYFEIYSNTNLGFEIGIDEEEYGFFTRLSLFLFSIYIRYESPKLRKFVVKSDFLHDKEWSSRGRSLELSIDIWKHPKISWNLFWFNGLNSRHKWRMGYWFFLDDIKDLFLGKIKREEKIIESDERKITMPEGNYKCEYKIIKIIRKRPRWFKKIYTSIDIRIPDGIPFPGKGENSWDCGNDARFGIYKEYCGSVQKELNEISADIIKTRLNRGGSIKAGL